MLAVRRLPSARTGKEVQRAEATTRWRERATCRRGVRRLVGAPRGLAPPPASGATPAPACSAGRAASARGIQCRSSTAAASTALRPLLTRLDGVRQVCERLLAAREDGRDVG